MMVPARASIVSSFQCNRENTSKGAVTLCNFSCNLSRKALGDKLHETLHKRSHLETSSCDCAKKRKVNKSNKLLRSDEGLTLETSKSCLKSLQKVEPWAKLLHSPILYHTCGSMCLVLCFDTKKEQKQRIVP